MPAAKRERQESEGRSGPRVLIVMSESISNLVALTLQHGRYESRRTIDADECRQLIREWRGRTYEVLVGDEGFCWQGTHYRSLSAVARKITGTPWSGPLFFGLKQNRSASRRSWQLRGPAGEPMEDSNAAG